MGKIETIDTLPGSSYLTLKGARKVLAPQHLELSRYTAALVSDGETATSVFTEKAEGKSAGKIHGVRQGARTEMSARELGGIAVKPEKFKVVDRIQGSSLLAVEKAEEVFLSRSPNRDLMQYKIEVLRDGDSIVVLFADVDLEPGTRGYIRARPGLEVVLDPRDLRVTRSNFIR